MFLIRIEHTVRQAMLELVLTALGISFMVASSVSYAVQRSHPLHLIKDSMASKTYRSCYLIGGEGLAPTARLVRTSQSERASTCCHVVA